jgi:hypothetical protein
MLCERHMTTVVTKTDFPKLLVHGPLVVGENILCGPPPYSCSK